MRRVDVLLVFLAVDVVDVIVEPSVVKARIPLGQSPHVGSLAHFFGHVECICLAVEQNGFVDE